MTELSHVSGAGFRKEVLESNVPVLVDFTAVWCGPCKMLEPIISQLAADWEGKVKVLKLDVDENPDLASKYQVMGVPTLILYVGGQPKERITGYQPKDRILQRLNPHFS